jgi:hypothetical protein
MFSLITVDDEPNTTCVQLQLDLVQLMETLYCYCVHICCCTVNKRWTLIRITLTNPLITLEQKDSVYSTSSTASC